MPKSFYRVKTSSLKWIFEVRGIRVCSVVVCVSVILLFAQFLLFSEVKKNNNDSGSDLDHAEYLFLVDNISSDILHLSLSDYPSRLRHFSDVYFGARNAVVSWQDSEEITLNVTSFFPYPAENRFAFPDQIPKPGDLLFLDASFREIPFVEDSEVDFEIQGRRQTLIVKRAPVNSVKVSQSGPHTVVLDNSTFFDMDLVINYVCFQFDSELSSLEERQLVSYIQSTMNVVDYSHVESGDFEENSILHMVDLLIISIIFLCLISCYGVVRYLYFSMRHDYAILRLCGATWKFVFYDFGVVAFVCWGASSLITSTLFAIIQTNKSLSGNASFGGLFYLTNIALFMLEMLFFFVCTVLEDRIKIGKSVVISDIV